MSGEATSAYSRERKLMDRMANPEAESLPRADARGYMLAPLRGGLTTAEETAAEAQDEDDYGDWE